MLQLYSICLHVIGENSTIPVVLILVLDMDKRATYNSCTMIQYVSIKL